MSLQWILAGMIALLVGGFPAYAAPNIYSVELQTQNEKHTTDSGKVVTTKSIINVAQIPYERDSDSVDKQRMLINWGRRLLETQWNNNPGVPVEIIVIPKSPRQQNIENMGDQVHQSSWLSRRRREFQANRNGEVPNFEDRIQDELVWKHAYKFSPSTDPKDLPENLRPGFQLAKGLSTGREHIIMGEPHRYNPQSENFYLSLIRTVVNGTLVASSMLVIASDIGVPPSEFASSVWPPVAVAMLTSLGLQWHGHKVRLFLKRSGFGFGKGTSPVIFFVSKQLMITATFVTLLRSAMVYSGLAEYTDVVDFAQKVGFTALKSVMFVGFSFGLIMRDRTILRNEDELSSRDFKVMKNNNRITLLASFLSTLGETLLQSKNPAIAQLGSIELTVAAGAAYIYWFKYTMVDGVRLLREGLSAAQRGDMYEARGKFAEMFNKSVQSTPRVCSRLFAH
tara:strand:- start:31035 stop:32390 length:1356 start_codon:yes stop_codon:yes gene_type:complete